MGTNTIPQRSDGVPMPASWFNDLRTALLLSLVPRNASGVPEDEAGSLGNADYQWLEARVKRLFIDGNLVDIGTVTGLPHRIISAAQNSTTKYPEFLTPAGAGNGLSCLLAATATAFAAIINNVTTNVSADTTFSSLTAAPGSNNTCQVDDTGLTGAASTKTLGELDSKEITIDTIGSEISAIDGDIAAFKIGTEIFLATVDTSNNKLWPIYRGWAGTSRGTVTNNDVITLMQINTLLLKNDGSTKVSSDYYPETVTTSPAAGTAGKIYIERDTNKIGYDTGSLIDYSYMILGYAVCDSADCINAQIWDMDLSWNKDVDIDLYHVHNTTTATIKRNSQANVNGQKISFFENYDMTTAANMDSGESIAANTLFYIYMKEDGSAVFSTVAPRKFCPMKKGRYHPLKYFRCVGSIMTTVVSTFNVKRAERRNNENIRDEMVPAGAIVAYTDCWYSDGSNTYSSGIHISSVANLKLILPDAWKVCDGSQIYDAESPFFNGSGRYIENLTDDRFLMGDTACNTGAGNNNTHTHNIAHAHQFMHFDNSGSDYYSLDTLDDSTTSIDETNDLFIVGSAVFGTGGTLLYQDNFSGDKNFYTTGVLSPPTGSAGSAAASGSTDHKPKHVPCIYIRKIK